MADQKVTKSMIDQSISLTKDLLLSSKPIRRNGFTERMKPLLQSSEAKHFAIRLMDVAFRSKNEQRIADYILQLLNNSSRYQALFSTGERFLVYLFRTIGYRVPKISIPLLQYYIRRLTRPVLFFVDDDGFKKHVEGRRRQGVRLNINLIGEALLGEREANERIQQYCYLLRQENIDYISIKISTLYSQISTLGYEDTLQCLIEKLSIIYRQVLDVERETGVQKFVNLDMEEYRDLSLTMDAFMQTLSLPEFKQVKAGIVLQAYLPDGFPMMEKLKDWAIQRGQSGGAPVKVRLVKGANMEMEKTEASLENWPLTTYDNKMDTDANFKKILLHLLQPSSIEYLHVGIASHNLFDIGFGLHLVKKHHLESYVDFEMLEGLAEPTVLNLLTRGVAVILYTPIVREKDYHHAIAYLVRRLDEGSQEGNFLKEGFHLKVDSPKWQFLEKQFRDSMERISTVSDVAQRQQDRSREEYVVQQGFDNVANTDWNLKSNREWIASVKERWQNPENIIGKVIPVVGPIHRDDRPTHRHIGWDGPLPWAIEWADEADYRAALASDSEWYGYTWEERIEVVRKVAVELAKSRGDLIGVAVTELGKTIHEVDVEVSEAIDFANYYAFQLSNMVAEGMELESRGIQLVLSPWNFPLAIPAGGVLASLAAGKRVILKPSINAVGCAYVICQAMWRAGIPRTALMLMPIEEAGLDPLLSEEGLFDAVILTGSTETAKFLLDRNPRLPLYAETGGKNATIVTSLADREQAIKNVIQSAFGNQGQKCSATSLLVLEKEVFEDQHFRQLLKDGILSKRQGNPWDFAVQWSSLSVPISDKIIQVIESTPDDKWLIKPEREGDFYLTPGVIWGIDVNHPVYRQELFGPILAVMEAENLDHGIDIVNGSEYGLTSGIESLSREEVAYWQSRIEAGNLYANRSTTGAIVQRQPFGGIKASSFGLGCKAGGPNYVMQFVSLKKEGNSDIETIEADYWQQLNSHFKLEVDAAQIRGQHNINLYLWPKNVICLLDGLTSMQDILRVDMVAQILKVPIRYLAVESRVMPKLLHLEIVEDWTDIYSDLGSGNIVRALNFDRLDDDFLRYCHQRAIYVNGRKPSARGRIELLNYLTEQNRSINYHRYGNLLDS
ncbi:proline dehydrogenase family protein [Membranihabitans marinus]|uniref:proline dehydrogenase family protein n=1 Tax=Membranihabitans marinus TaxID=1227546 RepID=UPI001F255692|nr:bifunctional proline dehydrogenase/L-glutamate gamma-semialdehyde dehydrogenase [Membranihabitans marinus]